MYTDLSQKWKNEYSPIKQISHPINLKSFGLQTMSKNYSKQFQVVQLMTQTQYHLQKLYKNPDHFCYNRNSNIMTYEKNRVLLDQGQAKDLPDNYINANYVDVDQHTVIATQGPLHSTILNFWRMVHREKVTAIFMLCKEVEKTKVKCDIYWPNKADSPLQVGDLEIRLIVKEEEGKFIRKRRFFIKTHASNEERQVIQYQFVGWPDGDKPEKVAQCSLLKLVNYFIQRLEKDEGVIVHCSAGVGRTGTFIAMAEIKLMIPKVQAISIFEIVRKLREQRWAMVYTGIQYQYLYQFTENESVKYFQPDKDSLKECDLVDGNELPNDGHEMGHDEHEEGHDGHDGHELSSSWEGDKNL